MDIFSSPFSTFSFSTFFLDHFLLDLILLHSILLRSPPAGLKCLETLFLFSLGDAHVDDALREMLKLYTLNAVNH